jgi:hypothetical protein
MHKAAQLQTQRNALHHIQIQHSKLPEISSWRDAQPEVLNKKT